MAKRVIDEPRPLIPMNATLEQLRQAAKNCKACDLWRTGTQTVFGGGAAHPKIMFVGEQPGNQEDLEGKPFVGPAGKLLDSALEEAEIEMLNRDTAASLRDRHQRFGENAVNPR